MDNNSIRSVERVVEAAATPEGDGMLVHRLFPSFGLSMIDPFLLLDEMGPMDLPPGAHNGFPDHPHRGFETVTYMLAGRFEHRDSFGHAGTIRPGDVQWMTAGSGLVHSEMPESSFLKQGGRLHGFQLWVNLPRGDKMMKPRYQELPGERIPAASSPDGLVKAKVIAGEALGASAAIQTRTPISYIHFTVQPGGSVIQPLAKDENAFAYVINGTGTFGAAKGAAGAKQAGPNHAVLFNNDGESVSIAADQSKEPLDVLLIAGAPLHEPVARYGPFVMNTQAEIQQAFEDFRAGKMGTIKR